MKDYLWSILLFVALVFMYGPSVAFFLDVVWWVISGNWIFTLPPDRLFIAIVWSIWWLIIAVGATLGF